VVYARAQHQRQVMRKKIKKINPTFPIDLNPIINTSYGLWEWFQSVLVNDRDNFYYIFDFHNPERIIGESMFFLAAFFIRIIKVF